MRSIPIDVVLRVLQTEYPDAGCTLDWTTPLELLIATILAAQCTDARVNMVTPRLFARCRTPSDYLHLSVDELERLIFSCGSYHQKARAIRETCRTIIDEFHGEVPRTMAGMLKLRGVGRKTASVVLATVFGLHEGIPIDTHCMRLSKRMGLVRTHSQDAIERSLMRRTPRAAWAMLSHLLVAHGRAVCMARSPRCDVCVLRHRCPSAARYLPPMPTV